MITSVDTDQVMYKTLRAYLCENVWNTPLTECRRNIFLRAVNNAWSQINTVDLGCMSVDLPYKSSTTTKKSFRVYSAAKCCMGGLIVDTDWDVFKKQLEVSQISEEDMAAIYASYNDGWLPLDKYLNLRPFDLRIHGIHGECLYRGDIFIRNHPYTNMFLIAIETSMAKQILGDGYDYFQMCMSVYYDSDYELVGLSNYTPMIQCFHPEEGETDKLNQAFNAYVDKSTEILPGETCSARDRTICFIDGREATPSSLKDLKIGQYIEIVYDPDVICSILLNLADPDKTYVFRSEIDSTYKYIIHVPKEVNPDQYIITHNTCDFFIRPTNTLIIENAHLKGLFIHRFNTGVRDDEQKLQDYMITQLTHNDFCISEKLTNSYLEYIGSSECVLRVLIRRHSKSKVLDVDANYLKDLYDFTDSEIVKFLAGRGDETLSFWKAAYLETEPYTQMLLDVPCEITETNVTKYVNALGYYNTLSILTPRVKRAVKTSDMDRNFRIPIPISMLACTDVYPLVYINGMKIDDSLRTYYRENQYLIITLSNSVSWNTGDLLEVEMIDVPTQFCYLEYPSDSHKVTNNIPSEIDIDVYEVVTEEPKSDYFVNHYTSSANTGKSFVKAEDLNTVFQGDETYAPDKYVPTEDLVFLNNKTYYLLVDGVYQVAPVSIGTTIPTDKTYYELKSKVEKYYTWDTTTYGKTYLICTKSTFKRIEDEKYEGDCKSIVIDMGLADHMTFEYVEGMLHAVDNNEVGYRLGEHESLEETYPQLYFGEGSHCIADGTVWDTTTQNWPIGSFTKISKVEMIACGREEVTIIKSDNPEELPTNCGVVWNDNSVILLDREDAATQYKIKITFGEPKGDLSVGEIETPTGTCTDILYKLEDTPTLSETASVTLPFINTEWSTIVFLNSKELIENIDYMRKTISGASGVQNTVIVFCNLSYLMLGVNNIEIYVTSDQKFMDYHGFMHCQYDRTGAYPVYQYGVNEEVNPYVYWHERLCTMAVDGEHRSDFYREDGYLKLSAECRNGGLYTTRGMVPRESMRFINQFASADTDMQKLNTIAAYLKDHAKEIPEELEAIPYSHHITSVTMAAVCHDVLLGLKRLNYSADHMAMLDQIPEYLDLKAYDSAMTGVATELTVTKSVISKVNNTYTSVDTSLKGCHRKWINKPFKLQIAWNCDERQHRWELKSVIATDVVVYYYADDDEGAQEPWKLKWYAAKPEYGETIVVESGSLDLDYIDLFPSYSSDLKIVTDDINLRQTMKALFPMDNIRDGATVI